MSDIVDTTSDTIDRVLRDVVRPALAAHGGSIRRIDGEDAVLMEMTGSCRACFFRSACATELVATSLRAELSEGHAVSTRLGKVKVESA